MKPIIIKKPEQHKNIANKSPILIEYVISAQNIRKFIKLGILSSSQF